VEELSGGVQGGQPERRESVTCGIEGNNCRLRHRERRTFRRTCCFSKKILYHLKVFSLIFFFINYGHV
jgi:IS1 family transposase